MPSSPADTYITILAVEKAYKSGVRLVMYHVKTQPPLPLRLKHNHVHDAHCIVSPCPAPSYLHL